VIDTLTFCLQVTLRLHLTHFATTNAVERPMSISWPCHVSTRKLSFFDFSAELCQLLWKTTCTLWNN